MKLYGKGGKNKIDKIAGRNNGECYWLWWDYDYEYNNIKHIIIDTCIPTLFAYVIALLNDLYSKKGTKKY